MYIERYCFPHVQEHVCCCCFRWVRATYTLHHATSVCASRTLAPKITMWIYCSHIYIYIHIYTNTFCGKIVCCLTCGCTRKCSQLKTWMASNILQVPTTLPNPMPLNFCVSRSCQRHSHMRWLPLSNVVDYIGPCNLPRACTLFPNCSFIVFVVCPVAGLSRYVVKVLHRLCGLIL